MKSPALSRRALLRSLIAVSALSLTGLVFAADDSSTLQQEVDGLTFTLRLPTSGIAAGEETVLTLRIEHKRDDGKSETLDNARIVVNGQMTDNTKTALFQVLPGGVSGEYSLTGTFATAGSYTLTVAVTPNGNKTINLSFPNVTVGAATAKPDKDKKVESEYTLKMEAVPASPLPAELVNLRFSIEDKNKKRVTEFEDIYDAPLHIYVLREDINELHHELPKLLSDAPGRKDDGVFSLDYTFPTGGTWRIIAEVAPRKDGAQILSTKLTIPGARALPEPLMAQISPMVQQGGTTLRFDRPVRLVAKETAVLPIRLTDSQSKDLSDLQFSDGALAHLYFADKNGTFIHALPDASDPRTGRVGSNILAFPVRFPKSGTYRGWLTFMRGTQTYTITFVVKVNDK